MKWRVALALVLAIGCSSPPPATGSFERASYWAISVPDLDSTVAWYERHLGFRPIHESARGEVRVALLRRADALLEVASVPGTRTLSEVDPELRRPFQVHGVFKVGLYVEGMDSLYAALEAAGLDVAGEIYRDTIVAARSFMVRDPDGITIQFFEPLEDAPPSG